MTSLRQLTTLDRESLRDMLIAHFGAQGVKVPFGGIEFDMKTRTNREGFVDRAVWTTIKVDTADAPIGTPSTMTLDHDGLVAITAEVVARATKQKVEPCRVNVEVQERRKTFFNAGYVMFTGLSVMNYIVVRTPDRIAVDQAA